MKSMITTPNDPPQRLLLPTPHDSENPTETTLRDSYLLLSDRLRPPFSLSIPSPSDYPLLTNAIAFALFAQPHLAKTHLTHLHSIVSDGYRLFTSTLLSLSSHSFPKLLPQTKTQLLALSSTLIDVDAVGADTLFISLLRNVKSGDFSDPNLWLSSQLIELLFRKWDWLLEEPLVLTSSLFVCLRLLADHYRLSAKANLDALKKMEIEFCVKALRQCFGLCLRIGRDLVRLLQDVVYIPELRDVWKDLLFDPAKFGVSGFSNISQLYRTRTPAHYFLLRITPEMEKQLRFLLSKVKWGSQKRYQGWFLKRHLSWPGAETTVVDVVRFVVCGHHPSNEVIQSEVISRWAVIGWLLSCCRRGYFEANVKLALFYDWLFFDERVDNIMNIEPAVLLMVHSVPEYIGITHTLLEFLFLLVDNYDVNHRELIVRGVSTSFRLLVRKGVVRSLDPLTSCGALSPVLRERLMTFVPGSSDRAVQAASDKGSEKEAMEVEVGQAS